MNMIIVLQGKISPDGTVSNLTSRRLVPVDLGNENELGDIQRIVDENGKNCWGLGDEGNGWWKIVDVFEMMDPTEELHENKYPVSFHLDEKQFSALVSKATGRGECPHERGPATGIVGEKPYPNKIKE